MDIRERGYKNAERWSDDRVFGPRAYFMPEKQPAHLLVDNIKSADEGVYRCRVDFKFAQTRNSKVILCLLYTSPSPRDRTRSRMPSSA